MIHRGCEGRVYWSTAIRHRYVDGDMTTTSFAGRNDVGAYTRNRVLNWRGKGTWPIRGERECGSGGVP